MPRHRRGSVPTYLGQLALRLPLPGERVVVAAVEEAGDLARDAHGGGGRAGVGHGPRRGRGAGHDAGRPVVDGRGRFRARVSAARNARIPHAEVLHQAGKGHCKSAVTVWRCVAADTTIGLDG